MSNPNGQARQYIRLKNIIGEGATSKGTPVSLKRVIDCERILYSWAQYIIFILSYFGKIRDKKEGFVNTFRMELNDKTKNSTKEMDTVCISQQEAEEYRAYKRQKKVAEIMGAIARSASPIGMKDDIKKLVMRASRFRQAAVKVMPVVLNRVEKELQKSRVKLDCIVGGNGETTANVKLYEGKIAVKGGAKELTLVLSPSHIFTGQYGEIKKEIRQMRRVGKQAKIKVWIDKKYPYPTVARIARLASEMGVDYVCVPYFVGCERLRYDLLRTCGLEVSEVETLADFKKMAAAGVERIVTSRILEIHEAWMKEAEMLDFEQEDMPVKSLSTTPVSLPVLASTSVPLSTPMKTFSSFSSSVDDKTNLSSSELKFV